VKEKRKILIGLLVAVFSNGYLLGAQNQTVVERVTPDRVLYSTDETDKAVVWVKNSGEKSVTGKLIAYELRDLSVIREVASIDITLAAGEEKKDISISWNVGSWMYGRELRVDLVIDGKVVSSASEFYQVADQWLRVNVLTSWPPGNEFPQDMGLFETYNNNRMEFAWAPCDFSDLTPDAESWYSGQVNYHKTTKALKAAVKSSHDKGTKVFTYAKYTYCGPQGFEFARQHPEWILREKDGSFFTYSTPLSPMDLARPVTEKQPYWQFGVVDFTNLAAVKYGAQEILDSAKMFGWDGAMFDGQFFAHDGYSWNGRKTSDDRNLDKVSARNIRVVRKIIRKELPNFAFWYNGVYQLLPPKGLEVVIAPGPITTDAALEDPNSSLLVESQGPNLLNESWRHWYDRYADQPGHGPTVQKYSAVVNSGFLWNMGVSDGLTPKEAKAARKAWVASNHVGSLFLAFNLHPSLIDSYAFRPSIQFMTRYSSLLWDVNVKKIKAKKIFRVKSSRELWWDRSAYKKDTFKKQSFPALNSNKFTTVKSGETLYMLHLLNTPTTPKPVLKLAKDPPQASNTEVLFRVPRGKTVEKAWALRPYEWGEKNRMPVKVELEIKKTSEGVTVKVPGFHYYTLVVFKLEN
jgi:hypothetical protein